jgi:hypothetical protein
MLSNSVGNPAWNRIKLKFGVRIRIRCQSEKLDPDPHQGNKVDPYPDPHKFADYNQNVWNMSLFEHLYLEVRIRIRLKMTSRIRIRIK